MAQERAAITAVLGHQGFRSKRQTARMCLAARAGFPEGRTFLRVLAPATMMILVGSAQFLTSVGAQQPNQSVEINPQELQEKPYVARFTQRPGEIRLQIKGDEANFQWVRYRWQHVAKPDALKINTIGELDGYKKEESLQQERWYQFKKPLRLALTVGPGDEEKYDLKLEFGRLRPDATTPIDSSAARASGDRDEIKQQGSGMIRIVDDSRPIVAVDPTSLIMERPRDANSGLSKQTLQLSIVDSTGLNPTWAFVKFKNRDIDVAIEEDTDKDRTTAAAPGEKLDDDHFFGFTGSIKVVLTRRVFVNDDPITLTVQGGCGVRELATREDAIGAIRKPDDSIAVRGPELKVQIATVKPTLPEPTSYWMIIILSTMGLVILAGALIVLRKRSHAMAARAQSVAAAHTGFEARPAIGSSSDYDKLTDPDKGQRSIAVLKQHQPGLFQKIASSLGFSKGEGESEEEKAAYRQRMSDQLAAETLRLSEAAARENNAPAPGSVREPTSGATGPAVRDAHVDARKPKEVEQISQEMLNEAVSTSAKAAVKEGLEPVEERVKAINQLMYELQQSFIDQRSMLQRELEAQKAAIAEQWRTTRAELEQKLDTKLNQSSDDIRRARDEFDRRLHDVEFDSRASHAEQAKRDGFYAALLSSILERSVDGLQGDSLSSAVGEAAEALNRFFQTEIPRSEVLDELASRAERLRASLKTVVDRASAFNSQAEIEIAEPLQKATNLVAELSVMRAQLRSRQLTLEARVGLPVPAVADQAGTTPYDPKLPVAVSAHGRARYTFIEELGFAIKREMDKFRDPPGYFRREIEKLATSDVIAVADICYSKTKNSDLEQSLQVLFSEAGLRSILPKPKERFDPTEQSIIQIISGGSPADSEKIAKVVSRGFYYNDGEKERLLRKAGVEVYR